MLRSEPAQTDIFPVLIHRYWRYDEGLPSMTLLWVRIPHANSEPAPPEEVNLQVLKRHVVEAVTLVRSPTHPDQGERSEPGARSYGTLLDGTPFVIYRILLYCDDFQKSSAMFLNGAAGGCYFLPLSLPPEARRNTSAVRIISLTPPGVSTNKVLHYIVDDIVHATIHGVDGFTPLGQRVKIFIDVVGFVGDYPASASVVDVVGHVCRAPCTLCSFRRLQSAGTEGSGFGFTTEVHANNSALMRHGERHLSLRKCVISDNDANILGMVANKKYSDSTCPLLHLQRVMESQQSRSALTAEHAPVVSNCFDAFRCNFVAPDHLLTGLGKNILNAMFRTLPSKGLRMQADTCICSALRDNGLLTQKRIYDKETNALYSMTLSELFCVLLVSVPTMRLLLRQCPSEHVIHDCFKLLERLQRLIALTYWWPVRELDGKSAVTLIHEEKNTYFSDLKSISKQYVKEVNRICAKSDDIKGELDKRNLHRLIELYEHTIPAVGHVREVMELVFESAHQPLKRCIARSNNHDSHIFAVEHCVGNDWQGRIAALIRNLSSEEEATRTAARRGIRRLLLGEQADLLDEENHNDSIASVDPTLHNLFTPALQRKFEKDSMISNFSVEKRSIWKARGKIRAKDLCRSLNIQMSEAHKIVETATRWINALYPVIPETDNDPLDQGDLPVTLYRKARRVKVTQAGRQVGKSSGYDTFSENTCAKVYLDPSTLANKVLTSAPHAAQARPFFFAVLAVLQRKGEPPFAICFKCSKREDCIQRDGTVQHQSFKLLRLSPDIGRVALYHICDEHSGQNDACKWEPHLAQVLHTKSLLEGGRFYFQARVHGYPPRIA